MRNYFNYLILILVCSILFTVTAIAQVAADVIPVLDNLQFLELLIASIGGMKGASTLAIVGIVLKILLAFLNSEMGLKSFRNLKGASKLCIVLGMSYASGIITLMAVNGLGFWAAFVHSSSLSAFVVLSNQMYKKFLEKK